MPHWSFDYNHNGQQPYFEKQLGESLRSHYEPGTNRAAGPTWATLRYDVLPNFWHGYSKQGHSVPESDLRLGTVELNRHTAGQGPEQYRVISHNATSGEHVRLEFKVVPGSPPELVGEWSVASENCAGDLYRRFSCRGYSRETSGRREIHLVVNGTDIAAGSVDAGASLSCNWALFDLVAQFAAGGETGPLQFAMLEDLEADPWETRNLAGEKSAALTLSAHRCELAQQERGLVRPPLEPGKPRDLVGRWGERLRARWAAAVQD